MELYKNGKVNEKVYFIENNSDDKVMEVVEVKKKVKVL